MILMRGVRNVMTYKPCSGGVKSLVQQCGGVHEGREREARTPREAARALKGVGVKWTEGNVILRVSCAATTESTFAAAAAATRFPLL